MQWIEMYHELEIWAFITKIWNCKEKTSSKMQWKTGTNNFIEKQWSSRAGQHRPLPLDPGIQTRLPYPDRQKQIPLEKQHGTVKE